MSLFFCQDNILMEFPICRLKVKELREIAKQMGLAHKGLKKCQLILLLERNGANEEEKELEFTDFEIEEPELEFTDFEIEEPQKKQLRFGETKIQFIPESKTKGRKSSGTRTTRTLTEEEIKTFTPKRLRKNIIKLEEAMPPEFPQKNIRPIQRIQKVRPSDSMLILSKKTDSTTNPYKILGVKKNSSLEEIKRAYKKESLKYHPDRLSNKSKEEQENGKERFQIINNAYQDILVDIENETTEKEIREEINKAQKEAQKEQKEFKEKMRGQEEIIKKFEEEYEEENKRRKEFEEKMRRQEEMLKNITEDFSPKPKSKPKPKPKPKQKKQIQMTPELKTKIDKSIKKELENIKSQLKEYPEDYDDIIENNEMMLKDFEDDEEEINKNEKNYILYKTIEYVVKNKEILLPKQKQPKQKQQPKQQQPANKMKQIKIKDKKEFDKKRTRSNPSFKYIYDMLNDDGVYDPNDEKASYVVESLKSYGIIE